MKAVILAGGYGTRLAEETGDRPKPMIHVGEFPLLWHIMKIYSFHGIKDFIICLGYKGAMIKDYFLNYYQLNSDIQIRLGSGEYKIMQSQAEDWTITLVDTGMETMTGGRLKRVMPHIGNETFCFTYGDGLADINISAEIDFHKNHGKLATVAAVRPEGRFGILDLSGSSVEGVNEKNENMTSWINGGFFVLEPDATQYIKDDKTTWELTPLTSLAKTEQLEAYIHNGFWSPCDTLREVLTLRKLWDNGRAPWKVW